MRPVGDALMFPPRIAEWLLTCSLAPSERAAVLGDLQEEFATLTEERGPEARETR